jgi:hypothetical protein
MKSALAAIELITLSHATPYYQAWPDLILLLKWNWVYYVFPENFPSIKVCFKYKETPKQNGGFHGSQHAVTPLWKADGFVDILSNELEKLVSWILTWTLTPTEIRTYSQQRLKRKHKRIAAKLHCILLERLSRIITWVRSRPRWKMHEPL